MPGCVAYGCSNSSEKGFLMKVFPRDPVIRAIWADKVNREGWTPTNNSRLCETHFESDQWEKTRVDGSRKLKWNAVPTLFAHVKINKQKRTSPTKRGSPIKKRKLFRTNNMPTSVPNQQHMVCEDTEFVPSTEDQSSHISPSLQVCKSYHCQKYGNLEPVTELQNIKQEPDYETDTNMETQSLIPSGELKHEQDYESQTVKNETDAEEESDMSPVIKWSLTSSPSLSCQVENSFLYCEKCQLKYEGGCPEHGPVIYIDNAEEGQSEGYSKDSSPQFQVVDNKDRQVLGREKVEQSKVCEAHSDDVGTLPNGGCSTESDEIFSVCEMKTELYVADANCGSQSNVEIKAGHYILNSESSFSCDESSALKTHMITNTVDKLYKFDVCGIGFTEQSRLKIHKRAHTGERPYACDVCGLGFALQGGLKNHKRTHTGEKPYKCDVCGLGFTQKICSKLHMKTHTGETRYTFSQQGNLKTHVRTHTGEKPYKCDVCGTGFTEQSSLKRHKRTHTGEKPYICEVCGTGFTHIGSLLSHKRTHTGEKPYMCDVCGAGFTGQSSLKKHKRTHTGEKPYKCDVCGTGFTEQGSLKRHKRTHTGEKRYKCDLCNAGFNEQGNLKSHKRTHTGEKPYICEVCGLGFTLQHHLKRHKRTHTGEKPYKCDVCGTAFAVQDSLKKHKRTHTEAL